MHNNLKKFEKSLSLVIFIFLFYLKEFVDNIFMQQTVLTNKISENLNFALQYKRKRIKNINFLLIRSR